MDEQSLVANVTYFKKDRDPYGSCGHWYVGITNDPKRRLAEHQVNPDSSCVKIFKARDEQCARNAEKRLLELGFDGGEGGGDVDSQYVYVFLETYRTAPSSQDSHVL